MATVATAATDAAIRFYCPTSSETALAALAAWRTPRRFIMAFSVLGTSATLSCCNNIAYAYLRNHTSYTYVCKHMHTCHQKKNNFCATCSSLQFLLLI